jgi:hypothetical protein
MSIAVLKRKTNAQYNNSSVNYPQFSLNGTHRNQGWVGQTNQSRSLSRTLMKGNVVKGHGGCCGTYLKKPIVQCAGSMNLNNNMYIKPSVLNTRGMISTQYKWITRPQPFTSVKPDVNNNLNSAGQYTINIGKSTVAEVNGCTVNKNAEKIVCNSKCNIVPLTNYNVPVNYLTGDPTKVETLSRTQSDYIIKLHAKCESSDISNVKKSTCGVPIP